MAHGPFGSTAIHSLSPTTLKMLRKRIISFFSVLALAVPLAACDDTASTGPTGEARVSLLLTDAPGDVSAAVVTITDIYLQGGGDSGRVYLYQGGAITTDLLTLSNDVLQLVDDVAVPAGRYGQLRFVISDAYIEVEEQQGTRIYATRPDYEALPLGATVGGELHCPSCAQSGFKVILNAGWDDEDGDEYIFDGGEYTLLVDFDVSRSLGHPAGNSGRWVMRPTLRATSLQLASEVVVRLALDDASVTLPIIGEVALDLADFEATLEPAEGGDPRIAQFTDADGDGVYEARFRYLMPGEYRVGVAVLPGVVVAFDRDLPIAVTAEAGDAATIDLLLTDAYIDG